MMVGIMTVWPPSMVSGYVAHCTKQKTKCFLRVCRSSSLADSRKLERETLILGQTSEKKRNWDRWTSSTLSFSVESSQWLYHAVKPWLDETSSPPKHLVSVHLGDEYCVVLPCCWPLIKFHLSYKSCSGFFLFVCVFFKFGSPTEASKKKK